MEIAVCKLYWIHTCTCIYVMQESLFFHFSQLSAMALIQGGGAMNFHGASTYNFMCGMKPADIIVSDEVTDSEAKLILEKVD